MGVGLGRRQSRSPAPTQLTRALSVAPRRQKTEKRLAAGGGEPAPRDRVTRQVGGHGRGFRLRYRQTPLAMIKAGSEN